MSNLWTGLNIVGSKLIDKGNQLANYIAKNKRPALEALTKMRDEFYERLEIFFIRAAQDPNVQGLSRVQINKIQKSFYRAKRNG